MNFKPAPGLYDALNFKIKFPAKKHLFYNAFIAFCKLLIISIVSPVAGTKYFIRKRGIVTSNDEKNEYYRIHNLITCRCL